MVNVDDVAAAILVRIGEINTFKLQKLVYYSQAWHLVWEEKPLFKSKIEAWANGPVCPDLYKIHRGKFSVSKWEEGDESKLSESDNYTVETIVDTYGHLSGFQLSELTHSERPWKDARKGLSAGERGSSEITDEAMYEYYGSLVGTEDAVDINADLLF